MGFSRIGNFVVVLIMTAVLMAGISFALQESNFEEVSVVFNIQNSISTETGVKAEPVVPLPPPPPPQKLSNPPEVIKAVYVTGWSAGTRRYLNYLSNLFETTEINAVVVDIKGSNGLVTYASGAEEVKKYRLNNNAISDINALVRFFHDKDIYVIGRIAVFEDPVYSKARPELAVYNKTKTTIEINQAVVMGQAEPYQLVLWKDNNGLSWLDPASKEAWDYNISLAKDALEHGFDEINFDYIRFPTDGDMENMGFPVWDGKRPMSAVIKEFFQYVRQELAGEKISADLFGLTTVNTDDMGIGQIIENAFETFDYISPMVYPSHYAKTFIGFKNPAQHPYEVIKYSMDKALIRKNIYIKQQEALALENSEAAGSPAAESQQALNPIPVMEPLAKFRPWLQDFDMGADYTADMVKKEIKATEDSLGNEYAGYMLWNPSNIYTQGAVLKIK